MGDKVMRDKVAEAIYRSCHMNWPGHIPWSVIDKYGRMADAAIEAIHED